MVSTDASACTGTGTDAGAAEAVLGAVQVRSGEVQGHLVVDQRQKLLSKLAELGKAPSDVPSLAGFRVFHSEDVDGGRLQSQCGDNRSRQGVRSGIHWDLNLCEWKRLGKCG